MVLKDFVKIKLKTMDGECIRVMTAAWKMCVLVVLFLTVSVPNQAALWPFKDKDPVNSSSQIVDKKVHYSVSLILIPSDPKTGDSEELKKIKSLLDQYLSLINKRNEEDLDQEQERYLVLEAPKEINDLLGTEGYFDNKVKIESKNEKGQKVYVIQVILSAPTRVSKWEVLLTGPIVHDSTKTNYQKRIDQRWLLKEGIVFKQDSWDKSKKLSLETVQKEKYPLARLTDSNALIDPHHHSAWLRVALDSGPALRFGALDIKGSERYPDTIIRDLAGFKEGDTYNSKRLSAFQEALVKEGHYRDALVVPLLNQIQGDKVPVWVKVDEQLSKSFDAALAYDSREGVGASFDYTYNNFLAKGWVAALRASWNQFEQEVSFGVTQPKKSDDTFWSAQTQYFHGSKNGLDTRLWSTGLWHTQTYRYGDARLGLEHYRENLRKRHGPLLARNHILMLTGRWQRNRLESFLRPEHGYYVSMAVGATAGHLASSSALQRYEFIGDYYLTPWERKYGTFLLRGQMGYIHANCPEKVPEELKFKLGGASSIRGYGGDEIGLEKDHYIYGGLAKLAATIEYQKPISDNWSIALFHDMGDVKNRFREMRFKHSTGLGLRWFSRLAPFSLDVAYAHKDKKVGWHLSLGARF